MKRYLLIIYVAAFLFLFYFTAAGQNTQRVSNGQSTVAINFPGVACTYNWVNDMPGIGLAASGTGNIPSFTAVNNGNTPVTATITATSVPSGYAYIANFGSNDVSVINTITNKVVATIPVGKSPSGVAITADGSRVYVCNGNSYNIGVINTSTNKMVATIPLAPGSSPLNMILSPDGGRLYVTDYALSTISVISTTTNTLTGTIAVKSGPYGIIVSPDGNRLYVTYGPDGSDLSVVDVKTNAIIATIPVDQYTYGTALSPDGGTLYASNHVTGDIYVISTATNTLLSKIAVGSDLYGLAVSPDGKYLYVAVNAVGSILIINTATKQVEDSIDIDFGAYGLSLTADGSMLYVTNTGTNKVTVINTATRTPVAVVDVGSLPESFNNFVITGVGCSSTPVKYTITVDPAAPAITVSPVIGSISTCAGASSASPDIQQFTVAGSNLAADIIAAAPAGFEISLVEGNGYTGSITLAQAGGVVNSTIIYVRSAANAPVGKITGSVFISSGSTVHYTAVAGVVNRLPTVDAVASQKILNGLPSKAVDFTGTGNLFNWVNDAPGIGLAANGSGNIPVFTAINKGASPVVAHITVTPALFGLAYIVNANSNDVTVFNTETNKLVTTIPVGHHPFGAALNPDGTRLYVTNSVDNTVSVINTSNNIVVATIAVSVKPWGIAVSPDGQTVYVADAGSGSISVISTTTNGVTAISKVGTNPIGITVSADGSLLFVANSGSNTVSVVSAFSYFVLNTLNVGSSPEGMVMSADGSRLYVANNLSGNVSVINTSNTTAITSIKEITRIPVGVNPFGLAINEPGSMLYVSNSGSNTVSVINCTNNTIAATIPTGKNPEGISLSPDGSVVCAANNGSDDVTVISTAANSVTATVAAGSSPVSLGNFVTGGSGCAGAPVAFSIEVDPNTKPTIAADVVTGNISTCENTVSVSPYIQQFTVAGVNLTGDVTATAPAGFEVSLSAGSGYSGQVNIVQTGGAVNSVTIYVRSSAAALPGNLSDNVKLSSAGADDVDVPVTALVRALPVVDPVLNKTYADGDATKAITFTGTGSIYNWVNDTPSIGLQASGKGDIASFTAINKGNSPVKATITATPQPSGFAYIPNASENGSVSVIDMVTNKLVGTIHVGQLPNGITSSPDGGLVYVANAASNSISVINTVTNTVIATIPVGSGPIGLAVTPDGSRLFVTYGEDDTIVSVIDTRTNKVINNIPTSYWNYGISVSPDGSKMFVVNDIFNTIAVISTKTYMEEANIPATTNTFKVEDAYAIVVSPDGNWIYSTNERSGTVSVISTVTNSIITEIPVGTLPNNIKISQDGSRVYVANQNSNNISVISTATNTVVATIAVGKTPYGMSLSPDGKLLYVVNYDSNNTSIINTETNSVINTVDVGAKPQGFGNFIIGPTGCNGVPINFTITVTPAPHPVIAETGTPAPLNTIYGTPSSATSFTISGSDMTEGILISPPPGFELSSNDISFSSTLLIGQTGTIAPTTVYIRLASSTHVGSYAGNILLTSKGADDVNVVMPLSYVTPAPLIIKADDKSKSYGQPNPPLTISYNSFVNNDGPAQLTAQPVVSTIATTTSPAGEYVITLSGAMSTDYTITPVFGVLTIIPAIIIPNTFTPNGDGINDTWNIKNLDFYLNCAVQIYNRYGENVYSSIGYGTPWDGLYKGARLPTGPYYYIIDLKNGLKPFSGSITIIR